jgi:hypothetical protein
MGASWLRKRILPKSRTCIKVGLEHRRGIQHQGIASTFAKSRPFGRLFFSSKPCKHADRKLTCSKRPRKENVLHCGVLFVTGRIGQVLLGISALGMAIAAMFTTDPIATLAGEMTESGRMRALGGQLNLTILKR